MAVPRTVFRDRLPLSNELYRLVQDQLSEAPRTNTLKDLRTTIETLSTFTGACESVLIDISSRGQKTDLRTAVEGIRNLLTWAKFLDTIGTTPSDPDFLFRAHKHAGTGQPTFVPDLDVPFDLGFRRTHSIDKFAEDLAEHLGKTRKEKSETYFVSMSPILEWTIHTAGQKWINRGQDEVGLAIFDVKKLQQNSGTIIVRVSDILKFLAGEGKASLIEQGLQEWARNCDEYVSVGKISEDGLVRWVVWDELYLSSANILSKQCFVRAYTLGVYRKWIREHQQHIELENICERMVEFGKVLAGPQEDILSLLIELLLKPGILFWGFITESSEDVVLASIRALVDETALQRLSSLTI